MPLINFDSEKVIATVRNGKSVLNLTANDIDNVICGAVEGGTNYWAQIQNDRKEWDDKPKGIPLSQWITHLLLNRKSVVFRDVEEYDGKDLRLTKKKLLDGIKLNAMERPFDCDLENADATTYDCIFQYALFGELIYG